MTENLYIIETAIQIFLFFFWKQYKTFLFHFFLLFPNCNPISGILCWCCYFFVCVCQFVSLSIFCMPILSEIRQKNNFKNTCCGYFVECRFAAVECKAYTQNKKSTHFKRKNLNKQRAANVVCIRCSVNFL